MEYLHPHPETGGLQNPELARGSVLAILEKTPSLFDDPKVESIDVETRAQILQSLRRLGLARYFQTRSLSEVFDTLTGRIRRPVSKFLIPLQTYFPRFRDISRLPPEQRYPRMMELVNTHNPRWFAHNARVGFSAMRICALQSLRCNQAGSEEQLRERIENVGLAGTLHDIKIGARNDLVWENYTPLADRSLYPELEPVQAIRLHPYTAIIACGMAGLYEPPPTGRPSNRGYLSLVLAEAQVGHHEKLFGKGYPNCWQNDTEVTRTIILADIWDTMAHPRLYYKQKPLEARRRVLLEGVIGKEIDYYRTLAPIVDIMCNDREGLFSRPLIPDPGALHDGPQRTMPTSDAVYEFTRYAAEKLAENPYVQFPQLI